MRYLANLYDVDPEEDWFKPGNSPVQESFLLCHCGMDLLIRYADADQFPSFDRLSRREGAMLIRRGLLFSGPVHAPLLAQAVLELLARTEGRIHFDDPKPPGPAATRAWYDRLRAHIQDYYRAVPEALELIDRDAGLEFQVLADGVPREPVRDGEQAGTAYSAALIRGEDPSGDPALVREQWEYARDFFIWACEKAMMRSAMERPRRERFRFEEVADDLIDLISPEDGGPQQDPKRLAYRAAALKRWEVPMRFVLDYAAISAGSTEQMAPSQESA